jgi:spore coat protein A, manganese oxidase
MLKLGILAGAGALVPWQLRGASVVAAHTGNAARSMGVAATLTEDNLVDPANLAKFVDPLPIPPVWTHGQLAARGLTMAESVHQFHRDLGPTPTWGYGGASYLGPTISAMSGVAVTFTARNRLGEHLLEVDDTLHGPDHHHDHSDPRVSLHLHGGYTEPGSDGYPEDTFTRGQDHVYNYTNDQQSGTIWYHDHALGITRLNVYAGLAGFYLIRDPRAEAGLPPAPFDIPLAIQDKSFLDPGDDTNPLHYPNPWEPEFFGDVAVVNGKVWPNLDVVRGIYRFRLLNGSSSRIYNLRLEPALSIIQIGTDTGLMAAPATLENIILAPGERADVLVDFSGLAAGDWVRLMNDDLPDHVVSPSEIDIPEIMQFTVTRAAGFRGPIPSSLATVAPLPSPVLQRNLLLTEIMDPDTDEPFMALLNNRKWDTTDIEKPKVDTVEQWNLINLTADTHPIHLHLVQFQLLNRQPIDAEQYLEDVFGVDELHPEHIGTGDRPFPSVDDDYLTGDPIGPEPFENGWKDTIQAHPGTVTRILVPFGPNADAGVPFGQRRKANPFTGEYVWHCHILDHEDNEMMLPYEVVP